MRDRVRGSPGGLRLRLPVAAGALIAALLLLALLLTPPSAAAAKKRITGKLSEPGYSVIAVAADGEGEVARADRTFRLRPPAKKVTLHLRDRDGVYAGPVVVDRGKDGKRAILGVKRGAKLGKVVVKSRKGYARAKRVRGKFIDERREAKASNGVPIGAGKLGLVRSKVKRPPPGDLDGDGIADGFDIDDDGDLVLDRYESGPSAAVRARASAGSESARVAHPEADFALYAVVLEDTPDGSPRVRVCGNDLEVEGAGGWPAGAPDRIVGQSYFFEVKEDAPGQYETLSVAGPFGAGCPAAAFVPKVSPSLSLTLKDTVNANAAPLSQAQFDETLAERASLMILGAGVGALDFDGVELDCGGEPDPDVPSGWSGGLSYCTPGGTGLAVPSVIPNDPPREWPLAFPVDCCDANGNGFGVLTPLEHQGCTGGVGCVQALFSPGATSAEIGAEDVLNWRVRQPGGEEQFPTILQEVFATVPALVSYDDGAGNSRAIEYPVPPPYIGSPGDENPDSSHLPGFPIAPCPAGAPPPCVPGEVVVTLEFWRPQREPVPGAEQGQWIDVGGLAYSPGVAKSFRPAVPSCPPAALSTTDPRLSLVESQHPFSNGYGFRDSSADQPADPADTLSFSVNLSKCLLEGTPESGERVKLWLFGGFDEPPGLGNQGSSASTQQLLFEVE